MDRDAAIAVLPPLQADVLRLRDGGAGQAAFAERLGLGPDEVEPVLRVADAKLHRVMAELDVG